MDKKKLLIYGLTLGGLGLAGYYIYEYLTRKPPQIINIYTGQTISNPSTVPGFTGPGIPGDIYVYTSIPPYSTITFRYSPANLPFSAEIYAGWTGSQPVNVTLKVTLDLLNYESKAFNYITVGQGTLNIPINLGSYQEVINSYTKVKIPISVNLYANQNILDLLYNYLIYFMDLGYLVYIYLNAVLTIDIYVNGIYAGTYKENFTFVEAPI